MPSKRTRRAKCAECVPAPTCRRTGLRSSSSRAPPGHDVDLPHHIMLEVLSFLETREIVCARSVGKSFVRDAPLLINKLQFITGQSFPAATQMNAFSRVTEVSLDGDDNLMQDAAEGLPGCFSLRRLHVSRSDPLQQPPLSEVATARLFALPLTDLDMSRVRIAIPAQLVMPAWRTLRRLVVRDAYICDDSLVNLVASMPAGPLPLRHLDLSRNPFGQMKGMRALSAALPSFPELESLQLTADRVTSNGATHLLGALLDGACPKLSSLDMSLNFLRDDVMDVLAEGLCRDGHGLQHLEKLGIGGRFSTEKGVTTFESLARALAAGGLPLLSFLHVQGDVSPPEVGPLLRRFKLGACPNLSVVKVERSTRLHPPEDRESTEDAVESMWELVTCTSVPKLEEVHVLGMNLGNGLEWAEEERTAFYRARNESSFHRLALAGANRGVMIFV